MATGALEDFQKNYNESARFIVGLIADYETTIGFLLAGIGEVMDDQKKRRNFMMVGEGKRAKKQIWNNTPHEEVEAFFQFLCEAKRVGVILISTEIYKSLYDIIKIRVKPVPIIIEMPSRKSLEYVQEKQEF